jgi:L-iditol 2-dehydrogenase
MAARAFGADAVAVTDLSLPKLAVATQQGAAATVHVARGDTPEHTAAALRHALRGAPEVVIDCCGFESSMATALLACASGGRVVLVGMGAPEMKLRLTAAAAREVDILGSFRYANTYPLCIQLISSKRVAVSPLITHRFQWSAQGLRDGFDAAVNAERSGAIKVMFSGLADANDEPHA